MKKIFLLVVSFAAGIAAYAQDDVQKAAAEAAAAIAEAPQVEAPQPKPVYWTKSLMTNLNFAQTKLWDWAAGGNDNYTMTAYVDANANYAKDKMIWNNRLQVDYGFLYSSDKPIMQKVKDRIYFESKWGYETPIQHLSYSANFDFKTQIDNNYTYGTPNVASGEPSKQDWLNARTLKSGLFSPAYLTFGLGISWDPAPWFDLNISPVTGGFIFCSIPELRKKYGMQLKDSSLDPTVGANYYSSLFQLGAQIKAGIKTSINDVVNFETQLTLFTDYLNHPFVWNRVNWDNKFAFLVGKYIKLSLDTWLIYDDTVLISNDSHPTGYRTVQFKEFFELGFSYTISSKK